MTWQNRNVSALTKEALVQTLTSISRTATVQGAVKDDYVASEALSRV